MNDELGHHRFYLLLQFYAYHLRQLCRYIARPAVAIERLSLTAQGRMPAQRGRGGSSGQGQGSAVPKHVAMHWAQCLKRVFGIEINPCKHCGAAVKIIASIEDPEVIGGFSSICSTARSPTRRYPRREHRHWEPPLFSIDHLRSHASTGRCWTGFTTVCRYAAEGLKNDTH